MQTRLGLFCESVIEAGLLATVAVVPVFFNTYSERTFEPDKAALLRSLVLLMAVAWLIRTIESWNSKRRVQNALVGAGVAPAGAPAPAQGDRRGSPLQPDLNTPHSKRPGTGRRRREQGWRAGDSLRAATRRLRPSMWLLLALLLAGVYCLTTIVSVAPNLSLWGSYQRGQGLFTLLSYIGVFLLAARTLRTREQVDRLVTAVLLTSVPVTLYAWLQQFGLDPQGWGGPQAGRVFSTLGNPIFLGGYLITVMPLAVARILSAGADSASAVIVLRQGGQKGQASVVQASAYGVLLLLQLGALIFTQSRGPLVGLLGSALLMFLLMAAAMGERRLMRGLLLVAAALGGLLVLLTVLSRPLQGRSDLPYLGRYGRLLDPQSGTAQQRILTWQGTVDLITSDPTRALVGYGPDTLIVTFNRHFPPQLVPLPQQITITFDRAHNAILDILATTGVLGLVVYLSFLGAVVYYGLEGLGLVVGSAQRRAFMAVVGIGALLGLLALRLLDGSWRIAGLGFAMGATLGVMVYLVGHIFVAARPRQSHPGLSSLLIAFLTAIAAHFIEIQFGIAVVPTTLDFWLFAVMTVLLAQGTWRGSTDRRQRRGAQKEPRRFRLSSGETGSPQSNSAGQSGLWTWLGGDPARAPESLLIGLLLATLGFGLITDPALLRSRGIMLVGLLALTSLVCQGLLGGYTSISRDALSRAGGTGSLVGNAALSLSWGLVFLIPYVLGMVLGDDGTGSLAVYYAYVLLTVIAVASSLLPGQFTPQQRWKRRAVPLYVALVLVMVGLAVVGNLNTVKADIRYKQALAYGEAGHWDESINQFEQALRLAPHQDYYAILLAGAYVQKVQAAVTVSEREGWMEKAEAALIRGWQHNPLYPDHSTKLGLLYRIWGQMSNDPVVQHQRLTQAEQRYAEAAGLSPYSIPVLNGWAMAHIALGNYDRAETILQRSLSLRPSVVETHLLLGDSYLMQGLVDDAAAAYAKAIELDSPGALRVKQTAVQSNPSDPARHLQLALVYRELGQKESSLREAKTAERLAGGELPALPAILASLAGQ